MNEKPKHPYEDILYLPHHTSRTHPPMPMSDRAAQFSPFSALTGYGDAIDEAGRLTENRTELNEEVLSMLNMKYQVLAEHLDDEPQITVTYFKPDHKKAGGAYATVEGVVKTIDSAEQNLVMRDGLKIPMEDIVDLDSDLFYMIYDL